MTLPERPCLCEEVILREVDGEYIAYNPVSDEVALLNRSAAAVLDACDGTRTVPDLVTALQELFSLTSDVARHDVEQIVREFVDCGLLQPSCARPSAQGAEPA